jgi:F0F1-type ATP synthase delta subunit
MGDRRNCSKNFTDGLVRISLGDDSLISDGIVRAVLRVLGEMFSGVQLRSAMCAYLAALEKHIGATSIKIEYCGQLSDAAARAICGHFEKILNRKLRPCPHLCDSLIAGIRVTIGDMVVAYSMADTLDAFRKSFTAR